MEFATVTRRRACAALALAFAAPATLAQAYPSRPVTLVVPGPAGGTPDIMARQLAEQLRAELGQPILIDNRVGANGAIGVNAVARAQPDGHTLLMGFAQTMAIAPVTTRSLPYDPVGDFAPIARLVEFELGLAVPASLPVNNVAELVAWLKSNADKAAFGSFGGGTPSQFAGAMFARRVGIDVVHVPFKGSAPLVTELIAGRVHYGFVVPQVARQHVESGKLRMLALTGETRSPVSPTVPTMKELGYDDVVAGGWYGLYAPKGTPQPVIDTVSRAVAKALKAPELAKVLAQQDLRAAYQDGRGLGAFQNAEIARWRAVAVRTKFTAAD
jgi:tripartite-type tricarboxylate transporter receptor subunit TctC